MSRIQDRRRAFEVLFSKTFCETVDMSDLSSYSLFLINGVEKSREKIDELIKLNIKNWKFERISRVSKCALRISTFEIITGDIPAPIAINEGVEISKIYGEEGESQFVQAVLSSTYASIYSE